MSDLPKKITEEIVTEDLCGDFKMVVSEETFFDGQMRAKLHFFSPNDRVNFGIYLTEDESAKLARALGRCFENTKMRGKR